MHKDGGQVASNIVKLASTFEMFKGTGHTWLMSKTSFLIGVSQNNLCLKLQTCQNLKSIGHRACKIIMKEKKHACRKSCGLQMIEFETSFDNSAEVSNSMQIF